MLDFRRTRDSLAQLGHDLDWRFVGPVSSNRPGDPGWIATLDGEVIARGEAIGILAGELEAALEERGFGVRGSCS